MGRKKTVLSEQRHRELGYYLAGTRDKLLRVMVEIANAYPHISRKAVTAIDKIDAVRCFLDDASCLESTWPGGWKKPWTPNIYYPAPEDRKDE